MRILFLFSYLFTSCNLAEPPAKAVETFRAKYPNAQEITWNIDRNGWHEADFTLNGQKFRADFEASGAWVETETKAKWGDLPDAVKKAFQGNDKKKDIVEIELVDSKSEGKFYDIEYRTSGHKQDIRITADGQVLGTDRH